jgi:hypothetical protein
VVVDGNAPQRSLNGNGDEDGEDVDGDAGENVGGDVPQRSLNGSGDVIGGDAGENVGGDVLQRSLNDNAGEDVGPVGDGDGDAVEVDAEPLSPPKPKNLLILSQKPEVSSIIV